MKMTDKKNGNYSLLGIVGLLLTIGSFSVTFISWSFARGFYSTLGLSSRIISLGKGYELFPQIGLLAVIEILFYLWLGYFVGTWFIDKVKFKRSYIRNFFLWALLPALIIISFIALNYLYSGPYFFAANKIKELLIDKPGASVDNIMKITVQILLPCSWFVLGVVLHILDDSMKRIMFIIAMLIPFLAIQSYYQREYGVAAAAQALTSKGQVIPGYEVPSVNIIADVDLGWTSLGLRVSRSNGRYTYEAKGNFDIRWTYDDNNSHYFLLEQYVETYIEEKDNSGKIKGSSGFHIEEFKDEATLKRLCDTLKHSEFNLGICSIEALNEFLRHPNLYNKVTSKHGDKSPSDELNKRYSDYKGSSSEDKLFILNRLVLEEFYPQETPSLKTTGFVYIPYVVGKNKIDSLIYRHTKRLRSKR